MIDHGACNGTWPLREVCALLVRFALASLLASAQRLDQHDPECVGKGRSASDGLQVSEIAMPKRVNIASITYSHQLNCLPDQSGELRRACDNERDHAQGSYTFDSPA